MTTFFFRFAFAVNCLCILGNTEAIDTIWNDTNSGWYNHINSDYVEGDRTTYHGWFNRYDTNVWYRNFSCIHYSTVTIYFTCNYGCNVESNIDYPDNSEWWDYCQLYFNDPLHSTISKEIRYTDGTNVDLSNDESQKPNCYNNYHNDQLFSETAATYTNGDLFLPLQTFEVAFGTYATGPNEYLGFSFIAVKCNQVPTPAPTVNPTLSPTGHPTLSPTGPPTGPPTGLPTLLPTGPPTLPPTGLPTLLPTGPPTFAPTGLPTSESMSPTINPTSTTYPPTSAPTGNPTKSSANPTENPTTYPSIIPTTDPTTNPSGDPTVDPTTYPTKSPTAYPTIDPTADPTVYPTTYPSVYPTIGPTRNPTTYPTIIPTTDPTANPTAHPTVHPTIDPTRKPTVFPTSIPTVSTDEPSKKPTSSPVTSAPTVNPSTNPSSVPSSGPSASPSKHPSLNPSSDPSHMPTTKHPTKDEDFSVGGNGNDTSEIDGVTIAMIAISLFLTLIFVAIVMFWYVRNKRNKEKSMVDFRQKTIVSSTVTVQVINGAAVSMVMAELAPDCDFIDTADIDGDGDTCFTFEDDEKASELHFELPENKDYVRRSIISAEDAIIIGGNETAGGMGWNEEFH